MSKISGRARLLSGSILGMCVAIGPTAALADASTDAQIKALQSQVEALMKTVKELISRGKSKRHGSAGQSPAQGRFDTRKC